MEGGATGWEFDVLAKEVRDGVLEGSEGEDVGNGNRSMKDIEFFQLGAVILICRKFVTPAV